MDGAAEGKERATQLVIIIEWSKQACRNLELEGSAEAARCIVVRRIRDPSRDFFFLVC